MQQKPCCLRHKLPIGSKLWVSRATSDRLKLLILCPQKVLNLKQPTNNQQTNVHKGLATFARQVVCLNELEGILVKEIKNNSCFLYFFAVTVVFIIYLYFLLHIFFLRFSLNSLQCRTFFIIFFFVTCLKVNKFSCCTCAGCFGICGWRL